MGSPFCSLFLSALQKAFFLFHSSKAPQSMGTPRGTLSQAFSCLFTRGKHLDRRKLLWRFHQLLVFTSCLFFSPSTEESQREKDAAGKKQDPPSRSFFEIFFFSRSTSSKRRKRERRKQQGERKEGKKKEKERQAPLLLQMICFPSAVASQCSSSRTMSFLLRVASAIH